MINIAVVDDEPIFIEMCIRDSPRIDDTQQLDAYLEYSNDIIQQAYSMMNMQNHKWTSRTKEEIDYPVSYTHLLFQSAHFQ